MSESATDNFSVVENLSTSCPNGEEQKESEVSVVSNAVNGQQMFNVQTKLLDLTHECYS
jgi:hypothetical protein